MTLLARSTPKSGVQSGHCTNNSACLCNTNDSIVDMSSPLAIFQRTGNEQEIDY